MDPIEIFELSGYVVQASSTNPEFAVNATEMRAYVLQQATARNVLFTSEIRAYIVQDGGPLSGVAVNATATYLITSDEGPKHMSRANTERAAPRNRRPGIFVSDHVVVGIEPDPYASALKSSIRNQDAGLIHMASTVYTIEVP